ncbi:small-subunit processome [Epithele typhae]|uniref:small-subunit processome n=1 Tax=Epithele typhae TaxID=378194 RepID=UPI002007485B|nr:small-subunit processome [Epithele typhae]KAH9944271.1 small-subunit processome [Epithele typhae]
MSSIKNSLHRRNHKERSQLSHRSRLGILEKHKDYVLRARDYHSKRDRLNLLREKAATRNKDEFYFSMTREKTEGGVHVKDRGNEALPTDIVKVLKTQDENYLRTMRAAGLKKIDRIKSQLMQLANLVHSADEDGIARERAATSRQASSSASPQDGSLETVSERMDVDMGWKTPESFARKKGKSRASAEDDSITSVDASQTEETPNHRARLLKELSARLVRDRQLRYAERELEMQRHLMNSGAARKLSGLERADDATETTTKTGRDPRQ